MSYTLPELLKLIEEHLGIPVAFPGHWSPRLFMADLYKVPGNSVLGHFESACQAPTSYLEFYRNSRGVDHPRVHRTSIWDIFERGSVMLYFEDLFLRLVDSDDPIDPNLVIYLDILSKEPIESWDSIVKNLGAYCYEYFAKEPESYIALLESRPSSIETMTDFQILRQLGGDIKPSRYDSRSLLISRYLEQKL